MGSVCLDDAWQACGTPEVEAWDPQHPALKVTAETELGIVARATSPDKERGREKSRDKSERANHRLCSELARLRQRLDDRDRTQSVVTYVALAIVVVLLVVVLQSTWKLQHATDCLLWYSRR